MPIGNLFAFIHQQNDKKQSKQEPENDEGGDDGGQFAAHDACEATLEPSGGCRRKDKKARGGEGGAEGGVEDGQGVCQQEVYRAGPEKCGETTKKDIICCRLTQKICGLQKCSEGNCVWHQLTIQTSGQSLFFRTSLKKW